jgi:hypothetical protein
MVWWNQASHVERILIQGFSGEQRIWTLNWGGSQKWRKSNIAVTDLGSLKLNTKWGKILNWVPLDGVVVSTNNTTLYQIVNLWYNNTIFTFAYPFMRMVSISSSVMAESLEAKTWFAPYRIMLSISSLFSWFCLLSTRRPEQRDWSEFFFLLLQE